MNISSLIVWVLFYFISGGLCEYFNIHEPISGGIVFVSATSVLFVYIKIMEKFKSNE